MKTTSPTATTLMAILILLLKCGAKQASASQDSPKVTSDEATPKEGATLTKGQKILKTDKFLRDSMSRISSYAKKIALENFKPQDMGKISKKCSLHLMEMATALEETKAWAFKMLDSWGKLPNGILSGGFTALGDFDQCLDVNVTGNFQGKNCILEIKLPFPEIEPLTGKIEVIPEMKNFTDPGSLIPTVLRISSRHYDYVTLRTSVCVPSSCSEGDLEFIARKVMEVADIEWEVHVTNCQVKESVKLKTEDYIAIAFFALMVLLVVTGTMVDVIQKQRQTLKPCCQQSDFPWNDLEIQHSIANSTPYSWKWFPYFIYVFRELQDIFARSNKTLKGLYTGLFVHVMLCFSIIRNTEKLMKENKSSDSLKIFYGMKLLSRTWVMLNHTYTVTPLIIRSNLIFMENAGEDILYQVVRNGFFCVDTFFFISGVLLINARMRQKSETLSIPMYIIHRLWRLMPAVYGAMALQRLIYRLGSGPLWHELFGTWVQNCEEKWWTNALLFNNIYAFDGCMFWTWYVAADMQLYIIALLIVLPIKRHPKTTLGIFVLMVLASIVGTAVNNMVYKIAAVIATETVFSEDDMNYYLVHGYFASYLHTMAYLIGMAVGYILYYRPKTRISTNVNILCWTLFIAASLTAVYSAYPLYNFVVPSQAAATTYVIVIRTVWPMALAWVTLSCLFGHGGFITKFLSWRAFGPLSRLTYAVYLVHPLILEAYCSRSRTVFQSDYTAYTFFYLGCIPASFCVAYVFSMIFESPFIGLEKIIFGRTRPLTEKTHRRENEDVMSNEDLAPVTKS